MADEDGRVVERGEHEVEVGVEEDDELLHRGLQVPRPDVVPDLQRAVLFRGQAIPHVLRDVVDLLTCRISSVAQE